MIQFFTKYNYFGTKKLAVISFVLYIGISDCLFHATIVIRGSKIKALLSDGGLSLPKSVADII